MTPRWRRCQTQRRAESESPREKSWWYGPVASRSPSARRSENKVHDVGTEALILSIAVCVLLGSDGQHMPPPPLPPPAEVVVAANRAQWWRRRGQVASRVLSHRRSRIAGLISDRAVSRGTSASGDPGDDASASCFGFANRSWV